MTAPKKWNGSDQITGKLSRIAGLLFVFLPLTGASQTFTCDDSFYVVTYGGYGSVLEYFVKQPGGEYKSETIPLSEPSVKITCLGFNVADLYLYGLDPETFELLRIDRSGRITRLGLPENLDTENYEYHAGEISPDGGSLTVVGREKKTGFDRVFSNINLTPPRYYAGYTSIPNGTDVALTDLATDPITGIRYGFDNIRKKIVTIASGAVSTHQFQQLRIGVGGLFFDRQGRLLGYGDPSGGTFNSRVFLFDKRTGQAQVVGSGTSGQEADGCSCPYTIRFERTVTPPLVLPCSEVTIEYFFVNHTGASRLTTVLRDELPEFFTITGFEVEETSIYVPRSGIGSSTLQLENLEILVQENVIRVTARVGEAPPGEYSTQASITNWPAGLGPINSDDPATPQPADPNRIRVADPETVEAEPLVTYTCNRDTAFVRLPIAARYYRWSDGTTGPVLAATTPGEYRVQAGNDCWELEQVVRLGEPPPPLSLELGENRRVRLGENVVLSAETNTGGELGYAWSGEAGLSCRDCPRPAFVAVADAVISLTVTDEAGCTATDSVAIAVDPVRLVYLSNAFSPDGDGVNDRFFLQGPTGELRHLRVFDRWGALVFERRDGRVGAESDGWDGTARGRPAPAGTYVVTALVRFPDGKEERYWGELVLLR